MTDELLPYYNRELAFLRRLGGEFAQAHPKIAGRLRLGTETAEDPHVERLLEGFAYLSARIRHKLDDDFPELTDAMLGVLYPHYQAPIPSMAIVQFLLDRGQGELTTGYRIPQGSALEAESPDGEPCRFRTCYPLTLWPVELAAAELHGRPFAAPATRYSSEAAAVLRLSLRCLSADLKFARLPLDSLRFFLKAQTQHLHAVYELLLNNVQAVALAASPRDPEPVILPADCLRPVGFDRDQGMLPYPARSFVGYRLLTEFFNFPQKFFFFDLSGLTPRALARFGNTLEVYFYLSAGTVDLERNVGPDMFQLGCTPVVNLYRHRAEPIALGHTEPEVHVLPDARRPQAREIYSVDRVTATTPEGAEVEYQPFYSFKHARAADEQKVFWHVTRRANPAPGVHGTEVYLTLVDLNLQPSAPAAGTLDVQTTCLDRDRPHHLAFGAGQPLLRLVDGAPVSRIECLTRPTATFRPSLRHGALWRLVSHLSLNHLSLADTDEGADALREILKLYDFADSAETRSMIDGLAGVQGRRVVGRVPGGGSGGPNGGFCRGLEVRLHFNEEHFAGSGIFLFASVLERFLGLYTSLNSFTRTVVTTNKREGELRRWPPRAGESVLL